MKYSLVALITILMFSSCNKENDGCNVNVAANYDPDGSSAEECIFGPINLEIESKFYFKDEPMTSGTTYSFDDGRQIKFDDALIYLSEIRLSQGNQVLTPDLDVLLASDTGGVFTTKVYPQGEIDGISFTFGVDSTVYYVDPAIYEAGHPLASQFPVMYWSWATGYRYMRIDGMVDGSAAGDEIPDDVIQFHPGFNENTRDFEFDSENLIITNQNIRVQVKIDLHRVLQNVDFTTERMLHAGNPTLATKIADNVQEAISLF